MKPVRWIGSSYEDFLSFPGDVLDSMGYALYRAQQGGKHTSAKPLKGFRGAGVVELVESHDGNAYRAVYTVRFESAIYVLHAFQKKSRSGIKTDKADIAMVERRLPIAEAHAREKG